MYVNPKRRGFPVKLVVHLFGDTAARQTVIPDLAESSSFNEDIASSRTNSSPDASTICAGCGIR